MTGTITEGKLSAADLRHFEKKGHFRNELYAGGQCSTCVKEASAANYAEKAEEILEKARQKRRVEKVRKTVQSITTDEELEALLEEIVKAGFAVNPMKDFRITPEQNRIRGKK